jgi:hypothetical protein
MQMLQLLLLLVEVVVVALLPERLRHASIWQPPNFERPEHSMRSTPHMT